MLLQDRKAIFDLFRSDPDPPPIIFTVGHSQQTHEYRHTQMFVNAHTHEVATQQTSMLMHL